MQSKTSELKISAMRTVCAVACLIPLITSCGSSSKSITTPVIPAPSVNNYFALTTEQPTTSAGGLSNGFTFSLNHTALILAEDDVSGGSPIPISRGPFTSGNGFLSAALNPYNGAIVANAEQGNWLLEEQGIMGFAYTSAPNATGLDGNTSGAQGQGDTSQDLIPFVSNASCPSLSKQQTYQFLTLPGAAFPHDWNYQTDTAYGSVQIATLQGGAVVNFTRIQQFLLPASGVAPSTAVAVNPGPGAISGSCGSSSAGNVVSVSYSDISGVPHDAEINLASGFMLEAASGIGDENLGVSNVLGAGFGALGLLVPSTPVTPSNLAGQNYQGFLHVPDSYTSTSSFGPVSSACTSFQASLKSLSSQPSSSAIFGGEYAGNDPSHKALCDLAIDLGNQDSKTNGLFTSATIYVGASFPLNAFTLSTGAGAPYSISAVAIAGQIDGQTAIFVLAQDLASGLGNPIGIYLMQAQK